MFLGKFGKKRLIIFITTVFWLLVIIIFFFPKNPSNVDYFNKQPFFINNLHPAKISDNILTDEIYKGNSNSNGVNVFIKNVKESMAKKKKEESLNVPITKIETEPLKPDDDVKQTKLIFKGPKNEKQKRVVDAFMHAWKGYKKYAWGFDELLPLSKRGNQWMGVGLTIVDSLDTMYIMGLEEEFSVAKEWVQNALSAQQVYSMQFFEVVIRCLGGLLSAYHLSNDQVFLNKATEFGEAFKPCLNSQNGIPCNKIITSEKKPIFTQTNLAEVGSIQLEFRDLSRLTGDPYYEEMSFKTNTHMRNPKLKIDGLIPYNLSPFGASDVADGPISIGAMADSFYEYLLKQWLQTGKTLDWLKDEFLQAHKGALKRLIKHSEHANLTYIGIIPLASYEEGFEDKMEHLACFYPGLLALAHIHGLTYVEDSNKPLLTTAAELTETCYEMYHQMNTGLSPESVRFDPLKKPNNLKEPKFTVDMTQFYNIHRPETVESLYYMYQATKDEKYRDWAWQIFEAFETYTRLDEGYAGVKNVDAKRKEDLEYSDKMETFYLAETLKYLFLMFEEGSDPFPLDKWVFNTEAHPLPVYQS